MKKLIDAIMRPEIGIAYVLIAYSYLAAIHLFVTVTCFDAETWYQKVTGDNFTLILYFVIFPLIFGSTLLWGKIKKSIKWKKIGLGLMWAYHLGIALLNFIYYGGTGTPWLPALCVGVIALILYFRLHLD